MANAILSQAGDRDAPTTAEVFAKCFYCKNSGELTFHCRCKKAFYCSFECQQADSSFHEEKCEGLECIEDWEQ